MTLMRELRAAAVFVVLATAVLGVLYPLVIAGAATPFDRAAVGRDWSKQPALFQSRPSATDYAADATAFNNQGPNQRELADQLRGFVRTYLRREGRYTPGLRAADVPPDAVTTSASGIDPDISVDNARIQANRVAARTGLGAGRVRALVDDHRRHGDAVDVTGLNEAVQEAMR